MYMPPQDVIAVQLVPDPLPADAHTRLVTLPGLDLQVAVTSSAGDKIVYGLAFPQATKHLPPTVVRRASGLSLTVAPLPGDPDAWLIPFFPEAATVGRTRAGVLDDTGSLDLLLAKSRRVVGFIVTKDRLPPNVTT